jgi:glutathione S-transferase
MYELYIANKNYSSWSLRPWILMKEPAIPFIERLRVFGEGSNWDAFRQFSPTGRVPCLHDGALVVWDSFGITEYLAERHAGVWPVSQPARAYARCAAAEMHSGFSALRQHCSMSCGQRVRLHAMPAALQTDIARVQELWKQGLQTFGGPYLAGAAFSAVDGFFCPVAFRVQSYGLQLEADCMAYVQRLLALKGMRDWYEAALIEKWRDSGHEQEVAASGVILQDLRR